MQKTVKISSTFSDLTRLISEEMPVFPGEPKPQFAPIRTIEKDGVNVTRITLGSHAGTHVDAPGHFILGGAGVDKVPLESFVGEAAILDIPKEKDAPGIAGRDLDAHSDMVKRGDIVLLYTGTADRWSASAQAGNFSYLEPSAAAWMVRHGVKCVGIDSFSVEKYESKGGAAHRELLSNGVGIIENLGPNLKKFAGKRMFLVCLPLLLDGVDAAPARAILFELAGNSGGLR
jgi:kynurenine formamidase